MNQKEFAVFTMALKTYYPREQLLPNKQAADLWFKQLEDIPYDVAEIALNKWVATQKWSPSIAEIRAKAREVVFGETKDYGKAWEEVMAAVREFGQNRALEALASLDELTREATKRIGFRNICNSENLMADRANFRMIYEELAARKNENDQIPQFIKTRIEDVAKQKRLEG